VVITNGLRTRFLVLLANDLRIAANLTVAGHDAGGPSVACTASVRTPLNGGAVLGTFLP